MCHGADRLLHKALGEKGKKESSIVEIKMKRDVQLQAELFFSVGPFRADTFLTEIIFR
jgi:hypothetical protein